ncbi:MAG: BamA/TamA family outer membrane protein, partial [Cyanobacteria bacterium REEB65]|nr:BamA/TamA family outer membrane protein [Cyanobacteria bacterium REEB65]
VTARDPLLGTFQLPAPLASYTTPNGGLSPYLDARAGYGLNFLHHIRIALIGHYMGSDLLPSGSTWLAKAVGNSNGLADYYDPSALIDGPIMTVGPHVDLRYTNDIAFPTAGWLGRGAVDFGPHWLFNRTEQGAPNDFAIYRAELSQFFPIGTGRNRTLLLNLLAGYEAGNVPMYFRFSSGGTEFQRGYLWDRFAGNELLVGTAEFRHAAWPDLIQPLGLGLMYDIHADFGRAWQAGPIACPACTAASPVPFGQDPRLGVGAGLGLMFQRSTLGRLDLTWGSEGLPFEPMFGQPTTWEKLLPAVGWSCEETW